MRRAARGFSLLELLVALAIFAVVAGIVLSLFAHFGRTANTESGGLEMQNAARVALEELARNIPQIGYEIDRSDPYNPTRWQRDVVYAGAHVLAFNADIDATMGPLGPSETLTFPGESYRGEGASASAAGAETWVYTLDADGDGTITADDRVTAAGSHNPAVDTENPFDFGLFRRIHGFKDGTYGGRTVPIAANLFTNATADARYADGTTPDPLFTYWLSEDIDHDGTTSPEECVVSPCPPPAARAAKLYLWGDGDFDGRLSETEKTALRNLPVGSPAWSKNPLAASGSLKSSTLSAQAAVGARVVKVATASRFATGQYVRIGTGTTSETFYVEEVSAARNEVSLSSEPTLAHEIGEPVTVLPQTLLRAIRTVQVRYDAITPTRDSQQGVAVAGRQGRMGTRGLDYRVQPFQRSLELVNLQTDALLGASIATGPPQCPLDVAVVCAGGPLDDLRVFTPSVLPTTVTFLVTDPAGSPMKGVPVEFSQSNSRAGSLSTRAVKTGADGKATVQYTPELAVADDTLTATGTCVNSSQQLVRFRADLDVKVSKLSLQVARDCLSTINSRVPMPGTDFSLDVRDASGPVANAPVELKLAFDGSLSPPPPFTSLTGELVLEGRSAGTTDGSGGFAPVRDETRPSGALAGQVFLRRDASGAGTRLQLVATPLPASCGIAGSPVSVPVSFYTLAVDSETPREGCTEISPCTIPAGSHPPMLAAQLSLNGRAAPGALVRFDKVDAHSHGGASVLMPGSTVAADSSGTARVQVGNNNSGITSSNPLTTTVDASSTGDPAACASGEVLLAGPRSQFRFEGDSAQCEAEVLQAWVSRVGTSADKICVHLRNANASTGCPIRPTAVSFTVFRTDGVSPDNVYDIEKIEGGAVTSLANCSTSGRVTLFSRSCNGNAYLANGRRWDFADANGCRAAPAGPNPGQYFVFNLVDFDANLAGTGRRIDMTVHYRCEGACPAGSVVQRTFRLRAP